MSGPVNLWSATTLIKSALGTSQPLVEWNARTVAEAAYDKLNTLTAFHEDDDRASAVKWLMDARWKKSGEAAARGTEVHTAAEQLALGVTPDAADHIQPYVRQYQKFLEDFKPAPGGLFVVGRRVVRVRVRAHVGVVVTTFCDTLCLLRWAVEQRESVVKFWHDAWTESAGDVNNILRAPLLERVRINRWWNKRVDRRYSR